MSDSDNDASFFTQTDENGRQCGLTWDEEIPPMDLDKLDVKSFNDALRQSNRPPQYFDKRPSSSYLHSARHSISSDDEILQKINVSKILGDEDAEYGDITFDMLIPTDKVGLVIGKGGKNIKALQEKSGARMNVIQHSNTYDEYDKTLRMIGPPDLVQHARCLVYELISRSPTEAMPRFNNNGNESTQRQTPTPAQSRVKTIRYPVPKISVGLIIGRGGETIRKIRTETGAKVQFDPVNNDLDDLDEQTATVTGKPDQIRQACQMIQELVRTALKGLKQKTKSYYVDSGYNSNSLETKHYQTGETRTKQVPKSLTSKNYIKKHISIPSDKANLVFEHENNLFEELSSQTGVYCCIDTSDAVLSEAPETVFILKGQPRQVEVATDLLMKKVRNVHTKSSNYQRASSPEEQPDSPYDPKSTEWGQGDPGAPWSMYSQQNQLSAGTQEAAKTSFSSFSHSQWLEYFQPERQRAQADAWEQKVRAEQNNAMPKTATTRTPSTVTTELTTRCEQTAAAPESITSDQILPEVVKVETLPSSITAWSPNSQDGPTNLEVPDATISEGESASPTPVVQPVKTNSPDPSLSNQYAHHPPPFPLPQGFIPQVGPSTRVVTLYYDINSNSVHVLNHWNYA